VLRGRKQGTNVFVWKKEQGPTNHLYAVRGNWKGIVAVKETTIITNKERGPCLTGGGGGKVNPKILG